MAEIDRQIATRVLIIEDEPLISMDLAEIVESLGHEVTTIARTAAPGGAAPPAARRRAWCSPTSSSPTARPASTRCATSSAMFEVPVIFITSFPERLLTGKRPEPTFLITKPYDPERGEGDDQPGALLPHHRLARGVTGVTHGIRAWMRIERGRVAWAPL